MTLRLRQLQVIHRHGDRTPLVNIYKGSRHAQLEEKEDRLWNSKLPTSTQLAQLRSKFSSQTSKDVLTSLQQRPFGYLTTRGIEQMRRCGKQLREYCKEELRLDTVTNEQIQIYSNSYTRTQISVQALWDGMLHDNAELNPSLSVLSPKEDIINTYGMFPEIMKIKAELEKDNAEFAACEYEMASIKQELIRLFPAVSSGQIPFSWMTAADYFVCRRAHHVSLIPDTEAYGDATEKHLGFRFHQFYSHRTILKLVAGRMMNNVLQEMQKATVEHRESKKIIIYSGHDVALLSALRSIDAEIAKDIRFWPAYSTALTLELLENDSGKFFIRTRLNDETLATSEAQDGLCPLDRFHDVILDRVGDCTDEVRPTIALT